MSWPRRSSWSRVDTLSRALHLAITAITDEQADRAVALSEYLSEGMTPEEVIDAQDLACIKAGLIPTPGL
jgi:hypothetical protein